MSDISDAELTDSQLEPDSESNFEKTHRSWQRERPIAGKKRKHVQEGSSSSSNSNSSSEDITSDSDACFDPNNSIISKVDTVPRKI
jgi:hypothetical protein